jgi:hypothetical protein
MCLLAIVAACIGFFGAHFYYKLTKSGSVT